MGCSTSGSVSRQTRYIHPTPCCPTPMKVRGMWRNNAWLKLWHALRPHTVHLGPIYTTYGRRYGTPEPPIHRCAATAPRGTRRTGTSAPGPAASPFARSARAFRCFLCDRLLRRARPWYHAHCRPTRFSRGSNTNGNMLHGPPPASVLLPMTGPPPRSRRCRLHAAESPAAPVVPRQIIRKERDASGLRNAHGSSGTWATCTCTAPE